MSLEVGARPPVAVNPWQARYLAGGTQHGFRNEGPSTVSVMEVFVRK